VLGLTVYPKCLPVDRIWPARCDRCVSKGLACSEPQKKRAEPRQRAASEFTVPTTLPPISHVGRNDQPSESVSKRQRVESSGAYRETSLHRETSQRDYGYTSLNSGEFRLLELHRGFVSDEIVCELHQWDGRTQYEAVSYLRSFDEGVPITMLTSRKKPLPKTVMPNLHSALKHLRLPDRSRFLWINALCIDHSNTHERNVQVHVVHKIFNQASKVCLWLGETNGSIEGDTSMAFEFAVQLLAPKVFDEAAKDVGAVRKWKALLDLISHPLFERRWVVQEVAVAGQATIHYGQHVMNWSDFADVVTMFEHAENQNHAISRLFKRSPDFNHHPDLIGDFQALGASRFINLTSNIFKKSKTESNTGDVTESLLSLEELVFQLASFKGWDPHDVIYACVSLSQEFHGTAFAVSEPSFYVRNAANKFLGLLRRKVRCNEKLAAFSSRELHSVQEAATSLLQSESSDIDSRREIESFVSQGQRSRTPYNVNYDLPVLSTYKEFITHVLRESKSLGILCRPWAPSKQVLADYLDGGVPSWIATLDRAAFGKSPTFASYVRINANPLIGPPGKEPYKASLGLPALWTFPNALSGRNRLLLVEGFVLTTISETRTEALGGNIPLKWLEFGGWDRRDEKPEMKMAPDKHAEGLLRQTNEENLLAKDGGEELPPESLWRTLVADRGPNGSYAPVFYRRACQYAFKQSGVASAINTEQLLDSISLSMVKEFLQRVQEVVWNRQLIKTKRGYLGLAPEAAEKGDLVCILYGCSVPVVIREVEGGTHELVGECYVHGMMDGAALAVQISHKIPKKTFRLQ
jgi:hypothetical protein